MGTKKLSKENCELCGGFAFTLIDISLKDGHRGMKTFKACDECLHLFEQHKSVVSLWDWAVRNASKLKPRGVDHAIEVLAKANEL